MAKVETCDICKKEIKYYFCTANYIIKLQYYIFGFENGKEEKLCDSCTKKLGDFIKSLKKEDLNA